MRGEAKGGKKYHYIMTHQASLAPFSLILVRLDFPIPRIKP